MHKIALFLATEKGCTCLKRLVSGGRASNIGCVVSFNEVNVAHDWRNDIETLCRAEGIRFFVWRDIRGKLSEIFSENEITSAAAVSWRYLLPLEINNCLKIPLIVFHDSLLPKYRGFAPTPTAIINGENILGITALFAADEADNGDIILQRKMYVPDDMYMPEIVSEQAEIYADMLMDLLDMIETGSIRPEKQDESQATYSIWRNYDDCRINWHKSSEYIYNFVRALGRPYLGAYCCYDNAKIIIDRSEVINDKYFEIRDAGKIWSIRDNMPEVVCGSGMLRIIAAHSENGERVFFRKLRVRLE